MKRTRTEHRDGPRSGSLALSRIAAEPAIRVALGKVLKHLLYTGAAVPSLAAALPMPWRLRIWWYAAIEFCAGMIIPRLPNVYSMLADDGRRYEMGKQVSGEMESIKVLELVLQELDRQHTSALVLARVYADLKERCVTPECIPYELAVTLLDEATRERILKHMVPWL